MTDDDETVVAEWECPDCGEVKKGMASDVSRFATEHYRKHRLEVGDDE